MKRVLKFISSEEGTDFLGFFTIVVLGIALLVAIIIAALLLFKSDLL